MTHDTVMKRYQCPLCPPYERAGGKCSIIFCRSQLSVLVEPHFSMFSLLCFLYFNYQKCFFCS